MSPEPVEIRFLGAADLAVLERVDPDVFDHPVRPDLAARYLAGPDNLLAVALQAGIVVGMASGDNVGARALYASVDGKEDPDRAVVYTWSLFEDPEGGM